MRMRSGKSSPAVMAVVLVVLIAAVVAVAWYWEPISYTVRLRTWDKEEPGRVLAKFLQEGKKGNQAGADALLGTKDLKPLTLKGKWVGYFMTTQAGTLHFLFSDLAPDAGAKAQETEFVFMGPGAALVTMPDAKGKPVKYRLEMFGSQWKVTEIRGGRVAS